MRRPALAAALLLLATGCATFRRPTLDQRIGGREIVTAIVTWNVNVGRGDLPRFVDDFGAGRVTGRPMRDYVILLQETVEGNEFDAMSFARAHRLHSYYDGVRMTERGLSGNAIISTRPLEDVRGIPLPRERRVRKALAATIEVEGYKLFAVSAHLENRSNWTKSLAIFSDAARGRQADALLRAIPSGPGFVGGDFNTWLGPTESAWRKLLRRFRDTPREGPEPTFEDHLVLDHLFFDLPDRWVATRYVVPNRYGSDHHPVVGFILEKRKL